MRSSGSGLHQFRKRDSPNPLTRGVLKIIVFVRFHFFRAGQKQLIVDTRKNSFLRVASHFSFF